MISKSQKLLAIILYIFSSNCEDFDLLPLHELNNEYDTEHLFESRNVSEMTKANFSVSVLRFRRDARRSKRDLAQPTFVVRLWPNGRIPVRTNASFARLMNHQILLKRSIDDVVTLLSNLTCIRFEQEEWFDKDFIEFTDEHGGCFVETIGNSGGRQIINLGDWSCWDMGVIFHEIMHKLGFIHEHQRNDRDHYVHVLMNRIDDQHKSAYERADELGFDMNFPGEYDYDSIMHYPSHLNGREVIECKPNSVLCSKRMGNRHAPSVKDIEKINELYRCSKKHQNATGTLSKYRILTGSHVPFLTPKGTTILCVVAVLMLFNAFVLCGLRCRIRKNEKRRKDPLPKSYRLKEINSSLSFMNITASGCEIPAKIVKFDPQIPISQQAENLPCEGWYEIRRELVDVSENLLGEGQFGKVFKGNYISPTAKKEIPVAVKIAQTRAPQDKKMLLDELKIMVHIGSHLNVLSLVGAITKSVVEGELYIVTEFCKWGELEKDPHLAQQQEENRTTDILTTSDVLSYCYQAAKGMDYLVHKKVLHRDLAARNLLLTENQVVKVADFGLAKHKQSYETKGSQTTPLPIRWMALESIVEQKFTAKSDVWSFGVVLWELFSLGDFPYDNVDMDNLVGYLVGGQRLSQPLQSPIEIYQLMLQTWQHDPLERPTFAHCYRILGNELKRCSEPLFKEINNKLAEEEEEKFYNYVNWMKIEPTSSGYENVNTYSYRKEHQAINQLVKVHTTHNQNIAVC